MKTQKLFLLISLFCVSNALFAARPTKTTRKISANANIYKKIVHFIEMEKGHKDEWFMHFEKFTKEKIEMLKKHHDQCADQHKKKMLNIEKDGCSEKLFAQWLQDAVDLHKKHSSEWRNMHERNHKQCQDIANRHDNELQDFEDTLQTKRMNKQEE